MHVAKCIGEGKMVLSPIQISHPLTAFGLGGEWSFWRDYDLRLLKACDRMRILRIAGWDTSVGVAAEVKAAQEKGIPVEVCDA
jgi:hypothetical protein